MIYPPPGSGGTGGDGGMDGGSDGGMIEELFEASDGWASSKALTQTAAKI